MAKTLTDAEKDDINYQYLPRFTVANAQEYLDAAKRRSARALRKLDGRLDIAYGDTPGQKLDVFAGASKGAPVQIFIHGGYWRARDIDRRAYSEIAAPLVAAGATVVLPDYDLCPDVSVTEIVAQIRRAVLWVHKNISRHNGTSRQIFVSGHSAGGHLTAMLAATDWEGLAGIKNDLIKGSTTLSGLFDIEPHRHSQLQQDIRLTAKEARLMSPMRLPVVSRGPVLTAVGGAEPDLFHWQSLQYAARLREQRIGAEYLSTPGDNHFTITDRLGRSRDPLTKAIIGQMGL
jgi:arylformamidase